MLEPKGPGRSKAGAERGAAPGSRSEAVLLRIVLLEIVPPVWRRLQVPSLLTLRQLHAVLNCAMGWTGGDAHRFRVGDALYGKTADGAALRDSRWVTLADVAALGATSFRYEILASETWEHDVRIEAFVGGGERHRRPLCLAGERAWPPEGDADGWMDRVDFLDGEGFEAKGFDVEAVNRALSRLR